MSATYRPRVQDREVTCASNIVDDVLNAGAKVMCAKAGGLAAAHVDGSKAGSHRATLVTGTGLGQVGSAFITLFMKKLVEQEGTM